MVGESLSRDLSTRNVYGCATAAGDTCKITLHLNRQRRRTVNLHVYLQSRDLQEGIRYDFRRHEPSGAGVPLRTRQDRLVLLKLNKLIKYDFVVYVNLKYVHILWNKIRGNEIVERQADAEQADETVVLVVFRKVGSKILKLGGAAGHSYTLNLRFCSF